jgi:hypothetical protein
MAGRAWPGAGGPGRPVRSGPDASQYRKATGQHPQATASTRRQHTSARRQHAGTRQRPVLRATGQHSRQLGVFCQVWGLGSLSSYSACAQAGLGLTAVARQPTGPSRRLRLKSLPILGGPDGGSGRTQDAGIPPARAPEGGRQGWGEGVICRKPALHHSDPAMAADRQPAPFWANHSSTRCVMSGPRTAPAFQLTWQ